MDAFDRARSVADSVPGRSSQLYDDVLAVGIEHPGGKFGTGDMLRVQGAVLARIPARMLVHPLPPARWRKLVGLPGNASKEAVSVVADNMRWDGQWVASADPHIDYEPLLPEWPQDACDAYCIALATRSLINTQAAA